MKTPAHEPDRGLLARLVRPRPVIWFFVLAFALAWAWWVPMVLLGQTVRQGDGSPTHFPGLLGPALAAILVTVAVQGRNGVRELLARMGRWRLGTRGWLIVLSPLGLGALAAVIARLAGQGWPALDGLGRFSGLPEIGFLGVAVLVVVVNGFGEEAGWRGFAQEHLQRRFRPLTATLVVACLWALWHAPMFAVLDSYQNFSLVTLPGFFLGLASGAIVLTWVYNTCRHSILAAAIWHGLYNLTAATEATSGTIAAVVTTVVTIVAVLLVLLEIRAGRHGTSILDADSRERGPEPEPGTSPRPVAE